MGHRALVAYERPDRLYDLRYSHWGGTDSTLATHITRETPLASGTVDADVLADSVAMDRILHEFLDPCVHEMLYLVSQTYEVDAYYVLWLEWGDGRDAGRGGIVRVAAEEQCDVHAWFRATKTVLADVIEMGALSRRSAQSYLEARVCEEHDGHLYTYGESLDGDDYQARPDRW